MADKALTYNVEMNLAQARNEARQLSGIYQQELNRVDLRVLDTGLNQATGEAKQLQTNLRGVTDEIERAGRASRNITTGGSAGGGGLGGLATGLIGGLTGYLATQGAQQIIQQAQSFAELGTQVRRADEAFAILSGGARTAEQRIKAIQEASNGTVSELKAMEIGTQLVSLRLAKTTDDFGKLTRAGREIALVSPTIKEAGEALTQLSLFASNEQSFARADQLGLAADEVRERMAKLRAENDDLSGSQAKLQASLQLLEEKFGAVLDSSSSAASGLEKFRRAMADARNELAAGPVGGAVDQTFGGFAGLIDDLRTNFGGGDLKAVQESIGRLAASSAASSLTAADKDAAGRLATAEKALASFNEAVKAGIPGTEQYQEEAEKIARSILFWKGATDAQLEALQQLNSAMAGAKVLAEDFNQTTSSGALAAIEARNQEIAQVKDLGQTFKDLDILIARSGEFTPLELPGIDKIQQQLIDLKFNIAGAGEASAEQQQTIERLQGVLDLAAGAANYMSTEEGRAAIATGEFNAALAGTPGYLDAFKLHALQAVDAIGQAISIQNRLESSLSSSAASLVTRGILTAQQAAALAQGQAGFVTQQAAKIAALPPDQQQFAIAEAQFQAGAQVRAIEETYQEQQRLQRKAASDAEAAFKKAANEAEKEWKKAAARLESDLRSTPGLFGTSDVTQGQIDAAKNGVPQNFADNFVRRLRDEVQNGKDWPGVSLDQAKEALARVGIVASDNAETVVQQITDAWNNSVLFSDPANLALIDEEAVRANLDLQEKARQGQENILKHFGVVVDEAVAAATGGGAAGGVTAPTIGPLPQLPTGDQAALAGGAAGSFALNVSPTTMADVTSALIEQSGAEQPRMEALGSLYGLYFANGLSGRDYTPTTESLVSSMAGALATQGDIIKGQGADYAGVMALGIAGFDFTSTAASAVIGLRSAFGTEENLNVLLGTGGAIAAFLRDGMTNEINKPDWAQTIIDSLVAQILASASAELEGG